MPESASSESAFPESASQALQYEFAAHLRNPAINPAPDGIEDRRMAIYRDLFYNSLEGLLAGTYPVIRKVLNDEKWHRLVRAFYTDHKCSTPLFPEIPEEFLDWLNGERTAEADDPPWLTELAHYEWAELALGIADHEPDLATIDRNGDLLLGSPVMTPNAWLLSYSFPVHRISPTFMPDAPEACYLLVYRSLQDTVGFMELNPVTARLIQLVQDNEQRLSGSAILSQIAGELQHPNPDLIIDAGKQVLFSLANRDVVLGTLRDNTAN